MTDSSNEQKMAAPSSLPIPRRQIARDVLDIPVSVQVELASKTISIAELLQLESGSLIIFEKAANEPLDIRINGQLVGRAEPAVYDDRYAIRITEISEIPEDQNLAASGEEK